MSQHACRSLAQQGENRMSPHQRRHPAIVLPLPPKPTFKLQEGGWASHLAADAGQQHRHARARPRDEDLPLKPVAVGGEHCA